MRALWIMVIFVMKKLLKQLASSSSEYSSCMKKSWFLPRRLLQILNSFLRVALGFSYQVVVTVLSIIIEVGNSMLCMIELEGLLVVLLFKPYGFGHLPVPDLFCYGVTEPQCHFSVSNASGLYWGMGI